MCARGAPPHRCARETRPSPPGSAGAAGSRRYGRLAPVRRPPPGRRAADPDRAELDDAARAEPDPLARVPGRRPRAWSSRSDGRPCGRRWPSRVPARPSTGRSPAARSRRGRPFPPLARSPTPADPADRLGRPACRGGRPEPGRPPWPSRPPRAGGGGRESGMSDDTTGGHPRVDRALDPRRSPYATKRPQRMEALRTARSGGVLLSQGVYPQVPSALAGLTAVFGMGTGVTPPPWPPEICCQRGAPDRIAPIGTAAPMRTPERARALYIPSPRPISTGRLSTLLCVHLRPINVMV